MVRMNKTIWGPLESGTSASLQQRSRKRSENKRDVTLKRARQLQLTFLQNHFGTDDNRYSIRLVFVFCSSQFSDSVSMITSSIRSAPLFYTSELLFT
jgi:hypothetical protein